MTLIRPGVVMTAKDLERQLTTNTAGLCPIQRKEDGNGNDNQAPWTVYVRGQH